MIYGYYFAVLGVLAVLAWFLGNRCDHYFGPPRLRDNGRQVQTCSKCGKERQVIE